MSNESKAKKQRIDEESEVLGLEEKGIQSVENVDNVEGIINDDEEERQNALFKSFKVDEVEREKYPPEDYERKYYLTNTKIFDCSFCDALLISPIYECGNGIHLACVFCYHKSPDKCKKCTLFSTCFFHCRVMERIIESLHESCRNLKHGCQEIVPYKSSCSSCKFQPIPCPFGGCNVTVPLINLSSHFDANHSDSVTTFLYNRVTTLSLGTTESLRVLQETIDGDLFLLTNDIENGSIGNVIRVNHFGELKRFTSPFAIDLEVKCHESGQKLKLTYKVEGHQSWRYKRSSASSSEYFLPVPSEFSFQGKLDLNVQISLESSRLIN